MNTCSYGQAIDGLLAVAYATWDQTSSATVVSDGPWRQSTTPSELVTIGLAALAGAEETATGVQAPRRLGGPLSVDEDYTIVNEIFVWTGGSDAAAQKQARDRALALLATFEQALRSNANLPAGSVLAGGAWVADVHLVQVDPEIDKGRFCRVHWNAHIKNVLT